MKQISSFTIDHDLLEKGMYVSRIDGDVITYDIRMKKPKHIDMLVNAMGVRSNNPLEAELKDCGCKVVVVGDASSTKNGYKNIREGFNAGNAV